MSRNIYKMGEISFDNPKYRHYFQKRGRFEFAFVFGLILNLRQGERPLRLESAKADVGGKQGPLLLFIIITRKAGSNDMLHL